MAGQTDDVIWRVLWGVSSRQFFLSFRGAFDGGGGGGTDARGRMEGERGRASGRTGVWRTTKNKRRRRRGRAERVRDARERHGIACVALLFGPSCVGARGGIGGGRKDAKRHRRRGGEDGVEDEEEEAEKATKARCNVGKQKRRKQRRNVMSASTSWRRDRHQSEAVVEGGRREKRHGDVLSVGMSWPRALCNRSLGRKERRRGGAGWPVGTNAPAPWLAPLSPPWLSVASLPTAASAPCSAQDGH